jgi:hypothetical protein
MSNTTQIQTKKVWTTQGEKDATILALSNFCGYNFDNGGGKVEYKLIGMESPGMTINEDGLEQLPPVAKELFIGTIDVPSSIIQQWGASDSIIWDYVCSQLNITRI